MKPEEMLVFPIKCKLYLYNLGPASSMDLLEPERTAIEDFISVNGLDVDIDDERFFHIGLSECPRINRSGWTTLTSFSKVDLDIKVPMIDGNKMFLPESFIKDFKEGETVHINLPAMGRLKSPNVMYRSNQPVYIVDLQCTISQHNSVFHAGNFEDFYMKLK